LSLGFIKCRFWKRPSRLQWCTSPWSTNSSIHLLLQQADELIQNDQHITTQKLATELSASKEYVNNITDALGHSKVCVHWVPGSLTGML